eukprot:763132-Hanusia_phi.AAC.1
MVARRQRINSSRISEIKQVNIPPNIIQVQLIDLPEDSYHRFLTYATVWHRPHRFFALSAPQALHAMSVVTPGAVGAAAALNGSPCPARPGAPGPGDPGRTVRRVRVVPAVRSPEYTYRTEH